jgi:hypothetical protein
MFLPSTLEEANWDSLANKRLYWILCLKPWNGVESIRGGEEG